MPLVPDVTTLRPFCTVRVLFRGHPEALQLWVKGYAHDQRELLERLTSAPRPGVCEEEPVVVLTFTGDPVSLRRSEVLVAWAIVEPHGLTREELTEHQKTHIGTWTGVFTNYSSEEKAKR